MNGSRVLTWGLWVLAAWAVGNLVLVVMTYQLYPGYVELNESSLTILTRFMLAGEPVYRALDAAERVTHAHGPLTFVWSAWPQLLFGDHVWSGRLGATAASLALPAVMAFSHRRLGWQAMVLAAAFGAIAIILHLNNTIVVRPDAPVAVLVALAVGLVGWGERGGGFKASILIGLCAGLIFGFKVNAVIYVAPVALYHVLGDWRRLVPLSVAAAIAAILPFTHPSFDPAAFLNMLAPISAKENTLFALGKIWWKSTLYLALGLVPALLAARTVIADRRLAAYVAAFVAMALLNVYPATKTGAGDYYFLPFIAVAVDLALRLNRAMAGRVAIMVILALMVAGSWQPERRFFKGLDWEEARGATAEIARILADHPGRTIEMGLGGVRQGDPLNMRFYAYRSLLVAAGHPYSLDLNTVMELGKLKVPMPEATYARLEACRTQAWLVPHGEAPFTLWGYYYQPAFDERFREAFKARYTKTAEYTFFDVWTCRP